MLDVFRELSDIYFETEEIISGVICGQRERRGGN